MPFGRVAILGLGLMGGSLARALSALDDGTAVVGWSPDEEEREAAVAAGAVIAAPSARADVFADADLVVLAAPLRVSCGFMREVAEQAPPAATISDVVSLKVPLAEAARAAGLVERWVGSHPMTGREASGFAASRADLFVDTRVWTVADDRARERIDEVHRLWEAVRSKPEHVDAREHDRVMALVSHLPQLISNALAGVLADSGIAPNQLGPGGRDMTRLGGSSSAMWRDLFEHSPPELARGLRALAESSERLAHLLESGDVDSIVATMSRTARWSRTP